MKDIDEKISKAKKVYSTIKLLRKLGPLAGPIVIGLSLLIVGILIVVIFTSFIFPILNFDLGLTESDVQDLNPRIQVIQDKITEEYQNIAVDGALMAATFEVAALYDTNINLDDFEKDYQAEAFINGTSDEYPSYDLLLEMAKGMIAHKITFTCIEKDVEEDEIPQSYQTSYLEELVGIDGYTKKTCQSGYEKDDSIELQIDTLFSLEVYEKVYLPTFFEEQLNLNKISDAKKISKYTEDVDKTYKDYIALIYGDGEYLEGISGTPSDPIMADDMSLPINRSKKGYSLPYFTKINDSFAVYRSDGTTHRGIDLDCDSGDYIFAVYNGKVIYSISAYVKGKYKAGIDSSYGNRVVIASDVDGDGKVDTYTTYNHLKTAISKTGTAVKSGDKIGICGSTGHSSGEHLHFEIINTLITEKAQCDAKSGLWLGTTQYGKQCYLNPEGTLQAIAYKICHTSSVKTYEYFSSLGDSSAGRTYYNNNMAIKEDGLLHETYKGNDYIGVALASSFGKIGSHWKFTLSTGTVLYVVKLDEKADIHTYAKFCQKYDTSVIEIIIGDGLKVKKTYSGVIGESGSFDSVTLFNGNIKSYESTD